MRCDFDDLAGEADDSLSSRRAKLLSHISLPHVFFFFFVEWGTVAYKPKYHKGENIFLSCSHS